MSVQRLRTIVAAGARSPVPVSHRDRIRAEQTLLLFKNCPVGVISAALVSLLLAIFLRDASATGYAFVWSAVVSACAAAHLLLCWRYHRAAPPEAAWRRWALAFSAIALAEGLAWAAGGLWFTYPHDLAAQLIVLLAVLGVVSGGVVVFGSYLPTYLVFLVPMLLPHLFLFAGFDSGSRHLVVGLVAVYLVAMPVIAWRFNAQLEEAMRLRFANRDLADDLGRQKASAEAANLAKSSFLAAASHDLRQPIHALGLFIGALRGRTMDAEAAELVDHIDGSVAAMDGLFASLLDISKLDAGVVAARIEPFPVQPLLERLFREHAGEAAAAGIALRLVPTRAIIDSDPVLLERVVRNLISNAVRYTDRGGVLIGCRRRGATLSIEVWDTGCGIPTAEQEIIFREFHQVGNPERDRTKGLGLGLAIVQRVAALLATPVALQSVPGRGSVFRVAVPLHRGGWTAPAETAPQTVPAARTGTIYVIDDELAVRQAMVSLLTTWGHRVVVAESAEALLATDLALDHRPDLIISDYRLREGANGIAAIRAVQARHGDDIPGVLITGDTAPDRIAEAEASGFLLLHKPLSNARLRAAIGNLLRPREP